jgi:ectoine hydroxylase-related dioxygenase (phytanoyl-CoA dioxygenase family)
MDIVGTGPDGSFQPLRIGPMGGILSLPGAADQAIHADTPHLFEHIDCLPAHYINAFCLGREVTMSRDGSTELGGTAFVHGSHRLSYTAAVGDLSAHLVLDQLVRPSLNLGDVVLFDCRVLHFGLANTSPTLDRPMLYVNYTSEWFHDPKNWNERMPIFSQEELDGCDVRESN